MAQKIVSQVVLFLLLFGGGWYLAVRPARARLDALRTEAAVVRQRLEEARRARAEAERLRAGCVRLEADLRALRRRLPAVPEIRSVFEDLAGRARGAGLRLALFRPRDPETPAGAPYRTHPVEIELEGGYHQFGRFWEAAARMTRLVVLAAFRLEATGGAERPPRLRITARAETYTYSGAPPPAPQAAKAPEERP